MAPGRLKKEKKRKKERKRKVSFSKCGRWVANKHQNRNSTESGLSVSQDQSEVREKPQRCDDDDDMSRIIRKEEHLKSSWLVKSVMSSLHRF